MTSAGRPMPWAALLGALEERNRRLAHVIEAGDGDEPPDLPLVADGPLPPHLELRARVLLAETTRLQHLAERRREATQVALRYSRA